MNEQQYIYKAQNIEFAYQNSKYIYVGIFKDEGYEYRYIDLFGNNICWFHHRKYFTVELTKVIVTKRKI